jgi:hypothetical protein
MPGGLLYEIIEPPLSTLFELLFPLQSFAGAEDIQGHRGILTSNKTYLLSIRNGTKKRASTYV